MKKEMDMLGGSLWDKILIFALPLAASSILQQLFNSADIAIVGRFVGSQALAAVGSNGPIVNLLINIFVGISVGANVVISRLIGAGRTRRISAAVHTAIVVAVISGIFVACVGLAITRPVLQLISTPDDIIDLSTTYLRIYFLGMPFLMLYNFSAAILRSRGDTKRPLICLTASGIVNVILNLFFVIVLGMGVAGVAFATVISQFISAALLVFFLTREDEPLKLRISLLRIDFSILKDILRIGVPAGLQTMVFSLSNLCIQSSVNSLGSTVVAASSASINLEIYAYYMLCAFDQTAVTFTGQNYGAGNMKRCSAVMRSCILLGFICTGAICLAFILFGGSILKLYSTDSEIISLAFYRLRIIMAFEVVNMALEVFSGSMRGLGYSLIPALISIAGICGIRILWVFTVFRLYPVFGTLVAIYPISWIITAAAIAAAYVSVRRKAAQKLIADNK
ncbi:MAG: MATE family efflux transporter [Candidatus Ornithomonoglobus sp.]